MVVCAALVAPAHAEKADRDKPMNVAADLMRADDVKQETIISGNVELTKGSILIRAAHVVIRQDPEGYQSGVITGSAEKPAFFRQKREGLDEFIEGESERIEYDGRADSVKFVGKAQLRRLRGATLADEITGAVIVYQNLTDTFSVDGSAAKAGSATPAGRVRAMLTPKPTAPASAAASPSPSAQPAALRPSSALGSLPK